MDSRQKEVQQAHLDEEKRVIRKLKQVYKQAAKDCEEKIQALASRTDMQNLQSIVYQQQYQQALKTQIDGVLDTLQTNEFDSVAEYLTTCYENGYVGTMYTLHGQGIPVITPIDQTQVVNAVQTESKLSESLYTRMGEDAGKLKKSIQSEMSRGIANGSTWLEIAQKIASGMNSPFKKALNNAIRIARTEGGRIISQASLDAAYEARENGADSVKQWNATLDGRTRPDHRAADGQIVELDEYFTVGGEKMKAPCIGGSARNVCNCRCCMDMIPRWTLDEYALQRLKDRAAFFGLDKTKDFEAFREKYLQAAGADGIIAADERDDLDAIETRSVTSIQHGFSAFPKDDVLSEYVQKVTPESGYYDVGMHGTSEAVCFGAKSTNMSPRTLANIIRSREDYTAGENIRLLSCSTGKSSGGNYCFAEELANALGVTVKAPNDVLFINANGVICIGDLADGEFLEFIPNQRRRLK